MSDLSCTSLLGRTLTFGPARYRLEKVLGGGATAVVFLGVAPEDPENKEKNVAIKVAKADEQWQKALAREWRNLRTLARAEEQARRTHYFPRVLYPNSEDDLRQDVYLEDGRATFLVLVQELVPGIGVHDLLLDYPPGLRLPEPLALEIACQYAEMLTILHRAKLTCADRKLADLRWQKRYDFRQGKPDDLVRWRDEPPGHLMVLDWNVTERASEGPYGTIALDIFRFGILWHRMLLGEEPRFRRGGSWQLEEPLEKHPVWPQLSFGTREILSNLLYPVLERRYLEANALLADLRRQVELWKAEGVDLISSFKPIHSRYVDHPWDDLTPADVKTAFAAADVLRVRIEEWREVRHLDFKNTHRGLRLAVSEAPFHKLREAMTEARWGAVKDEIERLRAEYHDPARLLHLDRYGQIAALADEARSAWEQVKPLFERSDLIFDFDRPGELEVRGTLNDEHVHDWKRDAEAEDRQGWQLTKVRLWQEAGYRLALTRGRTLKDSGEYSAANDVFSHMSTLRQSLIAHGPQIMPWLDQLYGDPAPEQEEIEAIVKAGEDIERAFERGLQAIRDDLQVLVDATNTVAAARRMAPDNPFLGDLSLLLAAEDEYRGLRHKNLLLEIQRLGEVCRKWDRLVGIPVTSSNDVDSNLASLERVLREYSPQIKEKMERRQSELQRQVLQRIGAEPQTDEASDFWHIRFLIETYRQTFSEDKEFDQKLYDYLDDLSKRCRGLEKSLSRQCSSSPLTFDRQEWQRLVRWAQRGELIADAVGYKWPDELDSEEVKKKLENRRAQVFEKRVQASGCLERLIGRRQEGGTTYGTE